MKTKKLNDKSLLKKKVKGSTSMFGKVIAKKKGIGMVRHLDLA